MSFASSTPAKLPSKRSSLDGNPSTVLSGWLARESNVVDKLLNKRYAALLAGDTSTTFVTYRKETDESPSKVWPITADTTVSGVVHQSYKLRHKHTSTVWAVARGAWDNVDYSGFTVTWPASASGPDKVTLAFESEEAAQQWHKAFADAIARAQEHRAVARSDSALSGMSARSSLSGEVEPSGTSLTAADAPAGAKPRRLTFAEGDRQADGGTATAEGGTPRKGRAWVSVLHINGVAVYAEQETPDGDGGAVMVSAVVRAAPSDVFRHLVQQRRTEGLGVFSGARVLEVIDANTQVVGQRWRGAGLLGAICAPRELVLLRTWRKDADGTYIVIYQSTKHRSMREAAGGGWGAPVRVNVQAAGYTVAPLMQKYTQGPGVESSESLVTLVLKADLGGFLSDKSTVGRMLGLLASAGLRAMIEPVVTSVVILRDFVEQDRFVVRPLSMTTAEAAIEEPLASELDRRRAAMARRSATMLAYRRESMSLAQQHAAESVATAAAAATHPRVSAMPLGAVPEGVEAIEAALPAGAAAAAAAAEAEDSWAVAGCCPRRFWAAPAETPFKVRGLNYLADKKKVLAGPPAFELVAVDLLELEEPMMHVARYLPSIKHSPAPFLFVVQLMVPASPPISLVTSWAAPTAIFGRDAAALMAEYESQQGGPPPPPVAAFFRAITEFVEGEGPEADARRNKKFKLIPSVAQGSWIIRQSVGTTPVLLGQKLTTKYFRGPNYFEVDTDIGSSSVAANVTNLVTGATKSLTLDMGVLIEGQRSEQLPEQLIGTVRLARLDLKTAAFLDEEAGHLVKSDLVTHGDL